MLSRLQHTLAVFLFVLVGVLMIGMSGCARPGASKASSAVPVPVSALTFSPDGKKLAASIGPQATIWDVDSGKQLVSLEGTSPGVTPLAFSGDGKYIAGGQGPAVKIWEADSGKVWKTLEGHKAGVSGVGFSADGKTLVSTAAMYNFRTTVVELWLWDLSTGKKLSEIDPKQFVITCLAMAPDRKTFATGSLDSSVKIWNLDEKKELAKLPHLGNIINLAFSPEGKMLVVVDAGPNVTLWDTRTWKEITKLPELEDTMASAAAFSPDGKHVAVALDDQTVKIWETQPAKLLSTLHGHSNAVKVIGYGADDKTLASGGRDGEIHIWDASSGETRRVLK
jgi:WD40 repeat protein